MATNTTVDGCYLNNDGLIEETSTKTKQSSSKSCETNDSVTYKTYTNERFLYSIDYPSNLIQGSGGTNGGGLEFKNSDGSVSLGAVGMNNATFQTAEYYYNEKS